MDVVSGGKLLLFFSKRFLSYLKPVIREVYLYSFPFRVASLKLSLRIFIDLIYFRLFAVDHHKTGFCLLSGGEAENGMEPSSWTSVKSRVTGISLVPNPTGRSTADDIRS